MYIKLIGKPSAEPLDLQVVKNYLRVEHSEDDELINQLIKDARSYAENFTGKQLMPAVYEAVLRYIDYQKGDFNLPISPFLEVLSFKFYDRFEIEYDLTQEIGYYLNTYVDPARFSFLAYNITESERMYPFRITFRAGFPEGEIPGVIIRGMYYLIGEWYDKRENNENIDFSIADNLFWQERIVHV